MGRIFSILIVAFFLAQPMVKGQQLPQFSQYIFNGLHINPGYAGYKTEGYIQSTYRSQWVGLPGAPRTFTITADLSANEGTQGFGVSLMSDQIGPTKTTGGLLTYAYRLQVGRESFLSLGLSGGFSEYMIDGDLFEYINENDPNIPVGRERMVTPNMNSGLFWHNSKFYAGVSAFNMIGKGALERQDISLAYHDFHYYITAGAMFELNSNVQFKPSFLIKEVKGAPTNYDLNAMFLFKERLWLGGSFRSNLNINNENIQENINQRNAVAVLLEIFATDNIRIGYAYDHNLNVLQNYRHNSHEISVGYYLKPRNVNMKNPRWF